MLIALAINALSSQQVAHSQGPPTIIACGDANQPAAMVGYTLVCEWVITMYNNDATGDLNGVVDGAENVVEQNIEPCKLPHRHPHNVGLGIPRKAGYTPSIGTVDVAVLFADFDDAPASQTPAETLAWVSPSAADFFNQVSYGRMTLTLDPHQAWLRLSQPSSHYGEGIRSFGGHQAFIQEAVDLADPDVDFSGADMVLVLANPAARAIPYGPAFLATIPKRDGIQADGNALATGVTSGADLTAWTNRLWLNHEIAHTMTLPDLYAFRDAYSTAQIHRYVGSFGLMSNIAAKAPEFFAFERWQLGWLDDDQIICQSSGELVTELITIEQVGGTKAIMVPMPGGSSAVVIESRRKLGYDDKMVKEGVLVYTVDTSIATGQGPIEVWPQDDSDPFRDQSPLAEGEYFTLCNVTITNVQQRADGDTIRVTVDDQGVDNSPNCAAEGIFEPASIPTTTFGDPTDNSREATSAATVLHWSPVTEIKIEVVEPEVEDPEVVDPEAYALRQIAGWNVYVKNSLLQQEPEKINRWLTLLEEKLNDIVTVVPATAVTELQEISIWISPPYPEFGPKAEYHPSRQWLIENDRSPEMRQSVEISEEDFEWLLVAQPWVVLHELAHGYHDRVLQDGYDNAQVMTAYNNAKNGGNYGDVYAMTDPQEYFAESTEAYFGENDFYPFTRAELEEADPHMATLLEELWSVSGGSTIMWRKP